MVNDGINAMLMRSTTPHAGASTNTIVKQLSRADRMLIDPHLEELTVKRGVTLINANEPLRFVYFPGSVLFSIEEEISAGRHIEIAVVGPEGLLGWPALLGCDRALNDAVAQMGSGMVHRICANQLKLACKASPTLTASLLRFVHIIIVQMGRAIASHVEDALDRRVARWLLMRHDRVGGDALAVRHEEIAESLSVRRASITDKFHILEGERLLRCNRGRVVIRDRAGLEAFAGPAYGVAEAYYRDLIAPFGKLHMNS